MFWSFSQMIYSHKGEISVYGVVRDMLKFPNRGVECITESCGGKIRYDFLRLLTTAHTFVLHFLIPHNKN